MKQNFTVRQGALDGVEAFLSVARHRSFRKAAAELGVTPSCPQHIDGGDQAPRLPLCRSIGWVERSETHQNISPETGGYSFAPPTLRCIFSYFLIYRKMLDPQPKSPAYWGRPVQDEGRFANVTDVGAGCGGRGCFRRESADV